MPVRGGHKFFSKIRNAKAQAAKSDVKLTVGFQGDDNKEKAIARIAKIHEFGEPKLSIPERPAFRTTLRDGSVQKAVLAEVAKGGDTPDKADYERAADAGTAALKRGYLRFHGKELSVGQKRRKRHAKQLVGHRGPKMINAIRGKVER